MSDPGAYGLLNTVKDLSLRQILQGLMSDLNNLKGANGNPIIRGNLDLTTHRVTNLADPQSGADAISKSYADAHYGAGAVKVALQIGGGSPLNVTGLIGAGGTILYGTHAERAASAPTADGVVYYETDRQQFYLSEGSQWIWATGFTLYVLEASLPADLTGNDAGFPAFGIDTGLWYVWSGNIWHVRAGVIRGVIGDRQAAPFANGIDAGVIFCATDLGNALSITDYGAGDWIDLVHGSLYGSASIADANTSVAVAGLALADAAYAVTATVVNVSGGAAAGATRAFITGKGTDGFTLNVEVAPGGGESVDLDWVLLR